MIITEPLPLPAIALLIAVLEVSFRIANPSDVADSFMSDAVFFIMGSLMMAVAIVHQGLSSRLALGIIQITGNKVQNIVIGFTSISALLASFIGEHTVVAMMLPMGLTLIKFASGRKKIPNLTVLLLFSIAYGATVGSVGTPSGGARNAIMIEYWRSLTEAGITLSYFQWMILAYPMVVIGIIYTTWILLKVFKPEYKILDTAVRKLRIQVARKGTITGNEIFTIIIFSITLICWIFLNEKFGMGIIAIGGAFLYLASGLVEWNEVSRGTNWGVILLFAGTISLGVQMKSTGVAAWIGESVIVLMGGVIDQIEQARYLFSIFLTAFFSNIMSSSGTMAVFSPIVLSMGGHPLFMGMSAVIASAFGYFSAVAAPACMIIYSSGMVKISDFLKAGWRMGLASLVTLICIILFYWPFMIRFTNFK